MSAVSAADLDDSNETVALSEIGEKQIAVSNDVNAIDDLNKDDSDSEAVLGNAVKSSAAGEKEILSVENSDSDVLGATGTRITPVNVYVDRNGALDVSGSMRDSNDDVIEKGTISVCLNDRVYATLDPGGALGFSTKVKLTPGSYNLVLRYHDDSGDYEDCEYVYENNPIVKEPPTWYVDGSKSSSGNGKNEANAFVTLAEALDSASDGDKIKIAAGTYTGSGNIGLTVDKNLTFEKYGDGEAIFDAQGQGRILNVNVNSMNITGLTFKNGKVSGQGAAIKFNNKLSNSVIIAKFINNTARYGGGAIYVGAGVSNSVINSTFENNAASAASGGAIYVGAGVSNSVINSTFENNAASANGGAIYWRMVSDSVINSTFKNNSAKRGGAIRFFDTFTKSNLTSVFINNIASEDGGANCFDSVNNVNIIGDFINNTAKGSGGQCGGGANAFYETMTNVSISGNFIGNSATGSNATDGGAANYFFEGISDVNITGKFINNTGNNVIYILKDSGNNYIQDSVFLNNDVNHIINVTDGKITAKDNWFGNNYTNFMNEPENVGIDLVNWLFLYAEPPFMFDVGQSSQITFGLNAIDSNYNGYPYDASKMNITLDLSQTLGELDKTSALIGEKITYTAKEAGSATVTGKFETASNTVSFTINDPKIPTEIKIANSTVNLKANDEIESGATLNPTSAGNVTYTSSNSSVAVVVNGKIKALAAGSANITVSFAGNDNYSAAENKTIVVNVALADASVSVNNDTLNLLVKGTFDLEATTVPSGLNVSYSSTNKSVVTVDSDGKVTAVGAGNATIVVTVGDDKVYAINSTNVSVNVKIPTAIDDILIPVLRVGNKFTLRYILVDSNTGSTIRENLEYTVTSTNESVVKAYIDRGIVIECVGEGNANVTAGFAGNDKYAAAENKTFTLTVKKIPTEISIANSTVDLKVNDEIDAGASLTPADAGNVTYTSSNSSVAIVKDDKIIAVGEGSANITVSFAGDNKYATAENKTITVNVSLNDASLSVDNSTLDLFVGDYYTLTVNTVPEGLNVTFTPDNSGVISVDENGKVTALKEGEGSVRVSVGGDGVYEFKSIDVTVTVKKIPTEISVANSTVDMKVNEEIAAGASLTPADVGNVSYTSSNSSVAVVENGKIKALAEGSANITVSFAGDDKYAAAENKTIAVTVTLNEASVSVNNATLDLLVGDEFIVVVTTSPEGLGVTFTPDNSGVVSVDENGVVTALKEGTATVKVSVGGDGVYALNTTDVTVTVKKIPTEISLANSTVDMKVNEEIAAGASLTPADVGNVSYTSSNSSVAVVENGKIKALAEGSANITVSFAGDDKYAAAENKTIAVTVTLNEASVSVNNATLDLLVGDEFIVVVTTSPEGLGVTFTPDNSGVVSVDENGVVTALKEGTATVKVSVGGDGVYALNTTDVNVTVKKIPTSISVDVDNVDMKVGDEVKINATLSPADAGELDYTSSDVSVVTVNGIGELIAVGDGTAVITVSFFGDDKYAAAESKNVTVTVTKVDTSIDVDVNSVDMKVGDEVKINATLSPADAGNVTFTSSNSSVVSVDAKGNVKAVGAGKANITVSFAGDDKYSAAENKTIAVTVSLRDASVSAEDMELNVGDSAAVVPVTAPEGLNVTYVPDNSGVVTVENGVVTAVKEGTAKITLTVGGDGVYAENSTTITVTVNKHNPTIDVSIPEIITVGDNSTVNVVLPEDATGNVTVKVDGNVVDTVPLKDGSADVTIPPMSAGNHALEIDYSGDGKYNSASKNTTIRVDKVSTVLSAADVKVTYSVNKYLLITLKDGEGNPLAGVKITVNLNGAKVYTTDSKGQVKIIMGKMVPKTYTAKITFAGNNKYLGSSASAKVVVQKANVRITALNKVYKSSVKVKLYPVILKDFTGKVLKNVVVSLKVNGKTYFAKTDANGKAIFKITQLTKKGTYNAVITFKGNNYYNKVVKKATIKVNSVWQVVQKGSKNSALVKKIQVALIKHGYYRNAQGNHLKIDGIYDDYTVLAVKKFQMNNHLKVTGKVDELTAKKLGII